MYFINLVKLFDYTINIICLKTDLLLTKTQQYTTTTKTTNNNQQ